MSCALRIPPLRARLEDIPPLADHLLRRIAKENYQPIPADALEVLGRHPWPGNVRELYHTLERAWLVGGGPISAEMLANDLETDDSFDDSPSMSDAGLAELSRGNGAGSFRAAIDFAEKQLLVDALRGNNGNKTAAAVALGMKASTFRDKLAKHGLL